MRTWPAKDAKDRFSEVMDIARSDGPQMITRRGKAHVVVISAGEYEKLKPKKLSFGEFLLSGPNMDDLDLERSRDTGREVDF